MSIWHRRKIFVCKISFSATWWRSRAISVFWSTGSGKSVITPKILDEIGRSTYQKLRMDQGYKIYDLVVALDQYKVALYIKTLTRVSIFGKIAIFDTISFACVTSDRAQIWYGGSPNLGLGESRRNWRLRM